MKLVQGDYVILDLVKPLLAKVVHAEKPYKAILEKDRDKTEGKILPVEFKLSNVIANLGKSPKPGKAFGVTIEPMYRTEESKFFGTIRIYQEMDDNRYSAFRQKMLGFLKSLKEKHLPAVPCSLEVRPVSGKYAGYYKCKGSETDILCVRPNENLDDLLYIFAHEYGHGIHYRTIPRPIWVKWIEKYHDTILVTRIGDDELIEIRQEIEATRSINDFLKESTEDTVLVVRACLKYIAQVHGLKKNHLDLMLSSDETLEKVWPSVVDLSDEDLVVSEYAKKSPEEFFAECFAFRFIGKKLPKNLDALMDRTLSSLIKPKGN